METMSSSIFGTTGVRPPWLVVCLSLLLCCGPLAAQQNEEQTSPSEADAEAEAAVAAEIGTEAEKAAAFEELNEVAGTTSRKDEAALNEDPEAQRRTRIEERPLLRALWPNLEYYGSVRLHLINNFDIDNQITETALGDGASRVGLRAEWQLSPNWWVFGRAEGGFDVLDTFTAKTGEDEGKGLTNRLLHGGFDSKNLTLTYGKSWSAYYKIAGITDRFSIFGGSAAGIYNAGTDGGATGMGRADEVLQARIFTNSLSALNIRPFNLNLQYQHGNPIPQVEGKNYGKAFGGSAWLETESDNGLGIAYQRSEIDEPRDPLVEAAGIDGHAKALALAFRTYGERWYAALVLARLENVETTDQNKYVNGEGAEFYAQWQFRDRWWLIGGGNWFRPDEDDPQAEEYELLYGVIGLRYTFDSFRRMIYAEYRIAGGTLADGTPTKNELTLGFRWDFGH
ncbi:MAG: hypothetical protein HKP03_03690 [Xanthomonadales bacterium]|nr:hypothetical protein [Xanthomonadales bacterium]